MVLLHRVIYEMEHGPIPPDKIIDHIDRNTLNNAKENLRAVTPHQSGCNRGKQANNTSGYIGVCWDKSNNKWKAYIREKNGKNRHIGRYDTAEEAARAYDQAAVERGDICELNFPEEHRALDENGVPTYV
jgi:hypothetical protein